MKTINKKHISIIAGIIITAFAAACSMYDSFSGDDGNNGEVTFIGFSSQSLQMEIGSMDIAKLTVECTGDRSDFPVKWYYDTNIIKADCTSDDIVFTALAEGTTLVKAIAGGRTAALSIRVLPATSIKLSDPYVYATPDIVQLTTGSTEKICASVYGGAKSNGINGYTFSIDKSAVASTTVEGNYCYLTGKSAGIAKVTIRHTASSWPYSVIVVCDADLTKTPYLSTKQNIINLNMTKGEKSTIEVDMANAPYQTYRDDLKITIVDNNGKALSDPLVQTKLQMGKILVTPLVSSQNETTITSVDNQTVTVHLEGLPEGTAVNPDDYVWKFSDSASALMEWAISGGSTTGKGDSIFMSGKGKRSGAVKVTVTHPMANLSKSFIVFVKNAAGEAASTRTYISTSQDYVELVEGGENCKIELSLHNLENGSENDLNWNIINTAEDGSTDEVIQWDAGTGTHSSASSRAAMTPMAYGYAVIKPVKAGSASITVTHPDSLYPAKIAVRVRPKGQATPQAVKYVALVPNPATASFYNGNTVNLAVEVLGTGASADDADKITWQADSGFSVTPAGLSAVISSTATGTHRGNITITHPNMPNPLVIPVISADKLTKTIVDDNGNTVTNDRIEWRITKGAGKVLSILPSSDGMAANVIGIAKGVAEVTATLMENNTTPTASVTFYILVKQFGVADESKPCYLTTASNAVTLDVGNSENINVTAVNMTGDVLGQIQWKCSPQGIVDITANRYSCNITAIKDGDAEITVSHPLSNNTLKIAVHVGDDRVWRNTDIAYIGISDGDDLVQLTEDSEAYLISARLMHTETPETNTTGIAFKIADPSIADLAPEAGTGSCYIMPKKAGKTLISITHPDSESREINLIVSRSDVYLNGTPYLTTEQNIVTMIQGETLNVAASIQNSNSYSGSSWSWSSDDGNIASILSNSMGTAMVRAVSPGTTRLHVRNGLCDIPLEIVAIVIDAQAAAARPVIQLGKSILNMNVGEDTNVTASLTGNTSARFTWTCSNGEIGLINGSDGACYIKALKAGSFTVTAKAVGVSNVYDRSIFVRVEDTAKEGVWIKPSITVVQMRPTSTDGTTVTAQLMNGDVLDPQNFSWWVDDESLVKIISNTGTCRIIPTGVNGVTTLHISHPKAAKNIDVKVLISRYDEFAFSNKSIRVNEKGMTFVSMQVPEYGTKTTIKYKALNNDICGVAGTNQVCLVAGVNYGNTTIKATLLDAKGSELGSCEAAVIVDKYHANVNTINANGTVINMNVGDKQTFNVQLSGNDITRLDERSIKWTTSDDKILSITADQAGNATGPTIYLKALAPGEAVLTAHHDKCAYDLNIHVIVPKIKEASISLDTEYLELLIGDQSGEINAEVTGGGSVTANNVSWSATKSGGANIVSVTRSGSVCNIVPIASGTTTVRAQLPTGSYADCLVIVRAAAELKFDVKTIHLNPHYSEVVPYTVTPENSNINWLSQMNTQSSSLGGIIPQYFTFIANSAQKTITVTAGEDVGSGKISGYFGTSAGTGLADLNVIVQYNYSLRLGQCTAKYTKRFNAKDVMEAKSIASVLNVEPRNGTTITIPYTVSPSAMNIEPILTDENGGATDALELLSLDMPDAEGNGVLRIRPKKTAMGLRATIKATDPKNPNQPAKEARLIINSYYDDPGLSIVIGESSGRFSKVTSSEMILGDGEDVLFRFNAKDNVDMKTLKPTYTPTGVTNAHNTPTGNSGYIKLEATGKSSLDIGVDHTGSDGTVWYRIGHTYDYIANNVYWLQDAANTVYTTDTNRYAANLALYPAASINDSPVDIEKGVITVTRPDTGVGDSNHTLLSMPVTIQVRECKKDFNSATVKRGGNLTLPSAAQIWCNQKMTRKGNLQILPRAVNLNEYRTITGDSGAVHVNNWNCAINFVNKLTDMTMGSENRAYTYQTISKTFNQVPRYRSDGVYASMPLGGSGLERALRPTTLTATANTFVCNTSKKGWRLPLLTEISFQGVLYEWLGDTPDLLIIEAGYNGKHSGGSTVAIGSYVGAKLCDSNGYGYSNKSVTGEDWKWIENDDSGWPNNFVQVWGFDKGYSTPGGASEKWHAISAGTNYYNFRICRPAQ